MNRSPLAVRTPAQLETISLADCETLLTETTTLGRVAFTSSTGQQLVPVNYVFRNGRVYFRTTQHSVLAELAAGCSDVAFEIDYPDLMTQHGWSVLVKGSTAQVAADDVDLSPRGPRPWAPGTRDVLIELTPRQITGKRIRRALSTQASVQT